MSFGTAIFLLLGALAMTHTLLSVSWWTDLTPKDRSGVIFITGLLYLLFIAAGALTTGGL